MRKPEGVERLYLDFDGFFASVEQAARPALRGRPIGVVPFAGTDRTCVIACSREAKLRGVKNVMPVQEARNLCPDIIFVPQTPDLYRRAHNALLSEIQAVLPIDAVKSIDEVTCRLDHLGQDNPEAVADKIKERIKAAIGQHITCSVGIAANRQLSKMACKAGKKSPGRYGNGFEIWHPRDMPTPLLAVPLDDIPGVGSRMKRRLIMAGIYDTGGLLATAPKHMRKLWRNVTGERLWYALHGYDIQSSPQDRGMFGHGRVLPPDTRNAKDARSMSRLLLVKAARRMRRENWNASRLWLWLSVKDGSWSGTRWLPAVRDDQAILTELGILWERALTELPRQPQIFRVHVTLLDITPADERQLDLLLDDDHRRQKWQAVTDAVDQLNSKYARTIVSLGEWAPPAGGHAGAKISFTRIPDAEDFW